MLESVRKMVWGLHAAGGFDLGEDPGVGLFGEGVDGDEDVVFEEGGFEDGGGAFVDGAAGGLATKLG